MGSEFASEPESPGKPHLTGSVDTGLDLAQSAALTSLPNSVVRAGAALALLTVAVVERASSGSAGSFLRT